MTYVSWDFDKSTATRVAKYVSKHFSTYRHGISLALFQLGYVSVDESVMIKVRTDNSKNHPAAGAAAGAAAGQHVMVRARVMAIRHGHYIVQLVERIQGSDSRLVCAKALMKSSSHYNDWRKQMSTLMDVDNTLITQRRKETMYLVHVPAWACSAATQLELARQRMSLTFDEDGKCINAASNKLATSANLQSKFKSFVTKKSRYLKLYKSSLTLSKDARITIHNALCWLCLTSK
jgi:hypothetical protein